MEISEEVIDGIRELITIGVGHSAGMINELTKAHVTLTVPEVRIFDINHQTALSALDVTDPDESSQVILSFSGEYTGSLSLIIPYKSAIHLVVFLTGEEGSPDEMDALRVETLIEVGNVVISSVMSSFSILLSSPLTFLYPVYRIGKWERNFRSRIVRSRAFYSFQLHQNHLTLCSKPFWRSWRRGYDI